VNIYEWRDGRATPIIQSIFLCLVMQSSDTNHSPPTIVVVDDDEVLRAGLLRFLCRSGLQVWGAGSAEAFYVMLLRQRADLVIVDRGLPGESGLSLVQRLTEQGVPVIVLTGHGDLQSRIAGLEAGALQYFVKPADMGEILAGIRSLLRHPLGRATGHVPSPWRLDLNLSRLIAPNQQAVSLTTREGELLRCLMAAQGNVLTKAELLQALGVNDVEGGFHRIQSQLNRLRLKTLEATAMSLPVRAVFGKGYVFAR